MIKKIFKKYKNIALIAIILYATISLPAYSTQLPQPVVEFIKNEYPKTVIRFDGLIELPDQTIYLPVLPLNYIDKDTFPAKIAQTIPADKKLSDRPEMILFSNNLALLKIIKNETDNTLSVNYNNEMPLKVKLGILPQDLVVPKGLILPTELKVILGNLKIPIKKREENFDIALFNNPKNNIKNVSLIKGNTDKNVFQSMPELEFLQNKNLYTSNFKENKLNLLNTQTGRIQKTITLPSMPSGMVLTHDGRYLLTLGMSTDEVFVIDNHDNTFIKSIKVCKFPSSITIPAKNQKVYVSSKLLPSIFEIDTKNMQVSREIKVIGSPTNLTLSPNKQNVFYSDASSGNVYKVNLNSEKATQLLNSANISKIEQYSKYLYVLSRSENVLTVYDLKKNQVIDEIKVGKKPVDLKIFGTIGKIYVLAAESDELNIIDMQYFNVIKTTPLKSGGFPGKLNLVEKENKILITNYDSYEIIIYDVDREKIQESLPVTTNISFLQLSKKED